VCDLQGATIPVIIQLTQCHNTSRLKCSTTHMQAHAQAINNNTFSKQLSSSSYSKQRPLQEHNDLVQNANHLNQLINEYYYSCLQILLNRYLFWPVSLLIRSQEESANDSFLANRRATPLCRELKNYQFFPTY